ncbi:hypothetical protein JCM11491_006786 [Sporobolomyces phaffii]
MNSATPSAVPFPPGFLPGSESPAAWTPALARPRLKRAHSSTASPAAPHNSPSEPLSPALPSSTVSPLADSPLDVIQELPQAETLAASASSDPPPPRTDEDRPTRAKRRRVAPDHDAFSRLSLNYSPIPSNSTHPDPHPLTSPTLPTFPTVPPTSPDFLPAHSSVSPPNFAPLHAAPLPPPFRPPARLAATNDPVEVEMSPTGQSSWDLDRHRIYVASLSDDDDGDDDDDGLDPEARRKEDEDARERFRLNSLISSGLPPALLAQGPAHPAVAPSRRRRDLEGGALILYQPPPALKNPAGPVQVGSEGRADESRVERLRREERERAREEEFREFRRESERIEADHDDDDQDTDRPMELE